MSTTTTNYGLVKPELTDAADITTMNPNWDKIDEELMNISDNVEEKFNNITPEKIEAASASDHQVKTYSSLDQLGLTDEGFVADDFSANMVKIINAIGNKSAILQIGYRNNTDGTNFNNFYNSLIKKVGEDNGVTFDLATHSMGFTYTQCSNRYTPAKMEFTVERVTGGYDISVFGCAINYNSDGVRMGKFKRFIHFSGVLPLDGSEAMTGGSIAFLNGLGKITTGNDFVQLETYKTANDTNNRRVLALKNSNDKEVCLQLIDWTNGSSNYYKVFGEHNKRIGTYKGEGANMQQRTINVGGIGNVLMVYCNSSKKLTFVTPIGGFEIDLLKGGNSALSLAPSYASFNNGVLNINSTTHLNTDTYEYTYQLL